MSLVELLAGLAVASLVAAIAITNLSMVGLVVARKRAATSSDDAVWLAHAAIARDLRVSSRWKGCVDAASCAIRSSRAHARTPVLVLDDAQWLVGDGLRRCEEICDTYLEGIAGIAFFVDLRDDDTVRRKALAEAHGDLAIAIEVVLWTVDGKRYSRTTRKHEHAP